MGANHNIIRLEGKRFGFLTVLRREGSLPAASNQPAKPTWRCRCTCGKEVVVRGDYLRQNKKKSCSLDGHFFKEDINAVSEQERKLYAGMIQRCYNPKNMPSYANYGARGVRVHRSWKNSFQQFLADMGPRPSPLHSLDRFPKRNGNYEPGNVRWATEQQQRLNQDDIARVQFRGEVITVSEYAAKIGVRAPMIKRRLARGWTIEDALTTPSYGVCESSRHKKLDDINTRLRTVEGAVGSSNFKKVLDKPADPAKPILGVTPKVPADQPQA